MLKELMIGAALLASTTNLSAGDNYNHLKQQKKVLKKQGSFATTKEVFKITQGNNKNEIVLDIRTEKEYKGGHIPNALRSGYESPLKGFDKVLRKLNIKTEDLTKIVLYCRTGTRAVGAKKLFDTIFKERGLNIEVKVFGLKSWATSCNGLKVETNVLHNNLDKKGVTLKETESGLYYSDKCEDEDFLEEKKSTEFPEHIKKQFGLI